MMKIDSLLEISVIIFGIILAIGMIDTEVSNRVKNELSKWLVLPDPQTVNHKLVMGIFFSISLIGVIVMYLIVN